MIGQTLRTVFIIATCLGVASCKDNAPPVEPNPAQATVAEPSVPAPAAPQANATTLAAWVGELDPNQGTELCAIDAVNGLVVNGGKFSVSANQPALFEGWASTRDLRAPGRISLVLDGAADFQVTGMTGGSRDDVAQAYGNAGLKTSGYRLELPNLAIPPGEYRILVTHTEDGVVVPCDTKQSLVAN